MKHTTRFCLNLMKITCVFMVAKFVEFREQFGFSRWASENYVHHRRDVAASNFALERVLFIIKS